MSLIRIPFFTYFAWITVIISGLPLVNSAIRKLIFNICKIGDGVNDAPALKTASIGVAMRGVGGDIAVDSADIALMSDGISSLPYLKRLSIPTVKNIRLSISLSMLINISAAALSVLGALTPTTGALVHNTSKGRAVQVKISRRTSKYVSIQRYAYLVFKAVIRCLYAAKNYSSTSALCSAIIF